MVDETIIGCFKSAGFTIMGYVQEKYTAAYFTGQDPRGMVVDYGAVGAGEWRTGGIYAEIKTGIDQVPMAGRRVLEIGYGRGESARYLLADKGAAYYVGVDFSAAAHELARQTLAAQPRERYELHQEDALAFLSARRYREEFDVALMLDVIEHIPRVEVQQMLPLVWRALRPGGSFIVQTPNYPRDEDLLAQQGQYLQPTYSDVHPATSGMHCNKYTQDRLNREMIQAGFGVLGPRLFQRGSSES